MDPIVEATARHMGITPHALVHGGKRGGTPALARGVCVWLAKRLDVRLPNTEIYRAIGMRRIGVKYRVEQMEKRKKTDRWLSGLMDALLAELSA